MPYWRKLRWLGAAVGGRFRTLSLWLALIGSSLTAQTPDPLVAGYVDFPPFFFRTETGARTGFVPELARLISEDIGVPLVFRDYPTTEDFVRAQATGETQLFAGGAPLLPLVQSNVFSAPIVIDALRVVTLRENASQFDTDAPSGFRIGRNSPLDSDAARSFLARNTVVDFDTPDAALMGLLVGRVDGLLLPGPTVYGIAREAGVDGRISFVDPPLQNLERFVILHNSRADLIDPVNAAIARLEADGRLTELRRRFNISVPPPPPEVIVVGMSDFPPYKRMH